MKSDFVLIFSVVILIYITAVQCKEVHGQCKRLSERRAKENVQHKNIFNPRCDKQGNFLPKQCFGGWCYCVEEIKGKVIRNHFVLDDSPEQHNMDCKCARRTEKLKSYTGCMPNGNEIPRCLREAMNVKDLMKVREALHCDADGFYETVQCNKKGCYCVNKENTKVWKDYFVPYTNKKWHKKDCQCAKEEYESDNTDSKKCDDMGNFILSYKSNCTKLRDEAIQNKARFIPNCDREHHAAVQCKDDTCYCAAKDGRHIGHYVFDKNSTLAQDANCNCARHEDFYKSKSMPFTPRCLGNGNFETCASKLLKQRRLPNPDKVHEPAKCNCDGSFKPIQCDSKMCYCTNKVGHHIRNFAVPICIAHQMTDCACALRLDWLFRRSIPSHYILVCDKFGNFVQAVDI